MSKISSRNSAVGMSHHHDLRELYARHMEFYGNGIALFQPISTSDMCPPCCGYFDSNGDWNNIATLTAQEKNPETMGNLREDWVPLEYQPVQAGKVGLQWQPKTSSGVEEVAVDVSGAVQAPQLPVGAETHVKYQSQNKFGAVLIASAPVTLVAYNHERLFRRWIVANRPLLYARYGAELKKYGLWVVTRTFSTPSASINAWNDNNKATMLSLTARAMKLGSLSSSVDSSDYSTDKDWCVYNAGKGDGVVVFMDGIKIDKWEWWREGLKLGFGLWERNLRSNGEGGNRAMTFQREARSWVPAGRRTSPQGIPNDYKLVSKADRIANDKHEEALAYEKIQRRKSLDSYRSRLSPPEFEKYEYEPTAPLLRTSTTKARQPASGFNERRSSFASMESPRPRTSGIDTRHLSVSSQQTKPRRSTRPNGAAVAPGSSPVARTSALVSFPDSPPDSFSNQAKPATNKTTGLKPYTPMSDAALAPLTVDQDLLTGPSTMKPRTKAPLSNGTASPSLPHDLLDLTHSLPGSSISSMGSQRHSKPQQLQQNPQPRTQSQRQPQKQPQLHTSTQQSPPPEAIPRPRKTRPSKPRNDVEQEEQDEYTEGIRMLNYNVRFSNINGAFATFSRPQSMYVKPVADINGNAVSTPRMDRRGSVSASSDVARSLRRETRKVS